MGKSIALVAAAVLAVVAVGAIVWSVMSQNTPASTVGEATPEAQLFPEATPPVATNARAGAVEELLGPSFDAAEEGRIEFVDEEGRVERELLYDRLEPREGGRIEVERPQAWIHMASGGVAHLQAARGSLLQPQGRREPESGRFDGDVLIRVFDEDPRPLGDESQWSPTLTFETASLNFDTTMGEVRTNDHVVIEAKGVHLEFTGFTLLIDEVRERLALFETNSAGLATIDPSEFGSEDDDAANAGEDASGLSAAIVTSLYRAAMRGDVEILFGQRRALAERFELWARLHDNRPTEATLEGLRHLGGGSQSTSEPEQSASADSDSANDALVEVRWSGGLEIRPLDAPTLELEQDDALARLSSPTRGAVELHDDVSQLSTSSVSLDFAIASRLIHWSGVGSRGVVLRAADQFEATTNRFDLDLASAEAVFPGPGVITSLNVPEDASLDEPLTPAEISWRRDALVTLARSETGIDFGADSVIQRARFNGDVLAVDRDLAISGDSMDSYFNINQDNATTLSRVVISRNARADAGPDGLLTAERIDIEFDLSQPEVTPSIATAQGDVRVSRDGSTLRADLAEATFRRTDAGRLEVGVFNADLGVVAQTADGVRMTADSLRAYPNQNVADLEGDPARISFGDNAVTGNEMRIDQTRRSLTVFGSGQLERLQADDSLGYESIVLQWADSMKYDDVAGEATFLGDCVLTADISELARDVVTAGRIDLFTRPYESRQQDDASNQSIERAVAYGAAAGPDAVNVARVESRRYVSDADAPGGIRLSRLIYLDGPEIIATVPEQELLVPHPGRLLIENRDTSGEDERGPDVRGTTLIEWDGHFLLKRDVGAAEFTRQVRVRHRPPGARQITELEAERLDLAFDPDVEQAASADAPQFVWAQAQGAVYAAQGRRQVIADRMLYDNSLNFAELTAWPGNIVTLYDADAPTPLTGELLRWDLLRDRVEWRGARPTAAPD